MYLLLDRVIVSMHSATDMPIGKYRGSFDVPGASHSPGGVSRSPGARVTVGCCVESFMT
jgi:hypothetical protein